MRKIYVKTLKLFLTLLFAGIVVGTIILTGNPASKYLCRKNAEEYIDANHPDWYIEEIFYDHTTLDYKVKVYKLKGVDYWFYLTYDWFGNLERDYFDTLN